MRLEVGDHAYASTGQHMSQVDRSLTELRSFAAGRRGYVGISWGKDSTCLAHLAYRSGIGWPLFHLRMVGLENPECDLVRDRFLGRWPMEYHELSVDDTLDDNDQSSGTYMYGYRLAERRFGPAHITAIRASESGTRKMRMLMHGASTKRTCAPMGWWSADDVFAYLAGQELPVHPAYAYSYDGILDREWIRVDFLHGCWGTEHGRREWEWRYYPAEMRTIESTRKISGAHQGRNRAASTTWQKIS
jgi:phosphoadenosine phosphosulfate reductase